MSELQELKDEKNFLEKRLICEKHNIIAANREIQALNKELKELKERIKFIENSDITISDHAILRYMERISGHEFDTLKNRLLTEEDKNKIKFLGGTCEYPKDGFKLIIKNNVVVTVVKE